MPKVAIAKNGNVACGNHEIGLARQLGIQHNWDPSLFQCRVQQQFRDASAAAILLFNAGTNGRSRGIS
jgi:hypothetical protein